MEVCSFPYRLPQEIKLAEHVLVKPEVICNKGFQCLAASARSSTFIGSSCASRMRIIEQIKSDTDHGELAPLPILPYY